MSQLPPSIPIVSVVMPTYKRPAMLKRAVDSVLAQTLTNWELIISDDENPSGETWAYLQEVAAQDSRIRIFQNPGPRGQIGNNNFAMPHARAKWIKPLFDDDTFKPDCLARFVEAVAKAPRTVVAHCLTNRWVHDVLQPSPKIGSRRPLERIPRRDVHLAMYLQDVEIMIPTQIMLHRSAIERGILWEKLEGVYSGNDTWWYARMLQYGDLLLINEPLVNQYWGHETGTTFVQNNPALFDAELAILRERYGSLVPRGTAKPPMEVVRQQVRIMRGFLRLRDGRYREGLLMLATLDLRAWRLAMHWLLRQTFPGRFELVKRDVVRA